METMTEGSLRSHRAKMTCTLCNRRKIKCDKNVPCGNCVKRGFGDLCARPGSADQSSTNNIRPNNDSNTSALVQKLLDRVSHLESVVKGKDQSPSPVQTPLAPSPIPSDPSPLAQATAESRQSSPVEPLSISKSAGIADAASVLEFLAWGRRKDNDFHDAPENDCGPRRHKLTQDGGLGTAILSKTIFDPSLDFLEILLPSEGHVRRLVEYHESCLLWYHGSFMGITFRQELETFYSVYQGSIRNKGVNLQWVSLLFAIITGSITCSSQHVADSWGFQEAERAQLSRRWYGATTTALNLANYLEAHTVYSVQAIATLTISAHLIGLSNSQSVLLAGANRIAQSLGLHRLAEEPDMTIPLSQDMLTLRRKRELGRRLWCQLCTQDWFSVPFSESYSLNSTFFDTNKPLNCNDEDMTPLPIGTPTITSYCNYLYDIAALIPHLQDAFVRSNTLFTKYEQVIAHDEKMRQLATEYMPTFLASNAPVASTWPVYVPWARRSLAICAAHKIIMIHRKFLGMSFTNSAFAFTRRTCLAAARTILKEAQVATDQNSPVLWIDQAFVVAGSIILCLDAFHRTADEPERHEHRELAEEAITYLSRFEYSSIADRGTRLLSFLVHELARAAEENRTPRHSRKRSNPSGAESLPTEKRARTFNLSSFMQSIAVESTAVPEAVPEPTTSATEIAWEAFEELFPPQTGFGGDHLFNKFFEFES